ncbi:TonB-dependent receptor plug domain-containing protein [Ideonella margarita]|uniref:TonB-dependent receptor n=1 Tax=Ideonella margarita TaxID=2984191 RepID=A0ABU9CCJ1_9BURK
MPTLALTPLRTACLTLLTSLGAASSQAQTPAPATPAAPAAPVVQTADTPAAEPAVKPDAKPDAKGAPTTSTAAPAGTQRVEITGGREIDTELRRRSTAAKIVVGRDEISKYGDASVGELLKRLPGVTIQGQPGRGGAIRMRGLGSGYTQILLDGERVQGGLSLDTIDPDQVERIEIIRAPTAETGARAIGGTINIITREGFVKRLNDLRLSTGLEQGRAQPGFSWSRDDKLGELDYNVALSAFKDNRSNASTIQTESADTDRTERLSSVDHRQGLHLTGRLQLKPVEGQSLMLMPLVIYSEGDTRRQSTFDAPVLGTLPYESSMGSTDWRFSLVRLNGQWRLPVGDGRLEVRGGAGQAGNASHTLRTELLTSGSKINYDDAVDATERSLNLNAKYSSLLEGDHQLVMGAELDSARRTETREQLVDGVAVANEFGNDLRARSLRSALYAQDEWQVNPNWGAYAGLRWEGISTTGGSASDERSNRSSVWTPLLHAVWKPDPKGRDQVRISLTRSYRSPGLSSLVGATWRSKGDNSQTNPDRAGNPDLKPEMATGIDLALERYLVGSGMLSVNLFHRQITDLMRTVVSLTPQADGSQRWVSKMDNVGDAITQGVELEAKFKLSDVDADLPGVELRSNASIFRSRVKQVPGPDNRLDQQPGGTLNLGADYKLPGVPLTVGGNVNWTPGYTTRLSETQYLTQNTKRVFDAYAMWQLNTTTRVRLSASNLMPRGTESISEVDGETATTLASSHVNWRLQLEMKL